VKNYIRVILLFLGALLATILFFHVGKVQTTTVSNVNLVQSLQKGGYIIYFRHPQTNPYQADTDTLHLENVKAQRQLTTAGEKQAQEIGAAFRVMKIPVGTVLVSQYYRAQEAAKLAGFASFQALIDVTEPQNVPPTEVERRATALRKLLATPPKEGTNTIIIAHRPNLQDAAGKEFGDLKEGEAVIFEPMREKGFRVVIRVASSQTWTNLAKAFILHSKL
jgi:phosphohistidine phosphatase SixA